MFSYTALYIYLNIVFVYTDIYDITLNYALIVSYELLSQLTPPVTPPICQVPSSSLILLTNPSVNRNVSATSYCYCYFFSVNVLEQPASVAHCFIAIDIALALGLHSTNGIEYSSTMDTHTEREKGRKEGKS